MFTGGKKTTSTSAGKAVPNLTLQQKRQVKQMQETLGVSKNEALLSQVLTKTKWDINAAINYYYEHGIQAQLQGGEANSAAFSNYNQTKARQLFDTYANKQLGIIDQDGIERFYDDLGVDPTDIVTLLASQQMGAVTMGQYTWDEFNKGSQTVQADTLQAWRDVAMPKLRKDLKNES